MALFSASDTPFFYHDLFPDPDRDPDRGHSLYLVLGVRIINTKRALIGPFPSYCQLSKLCRLVEGQDVGRLDV